MTDYDPIIGYIIEDAAGPDNDLPLTICPTCLLLTDNHDHLFPIDATKVDTLTDSGEPDLSCDECGDPIRGPHARAYYAKS